MISSAGRRQKKKSRRRADTFSRAYSISAALIIRAAVSFCSFSGIKPPAMPVESRALASSKKPPVLQ